MWRSQVSRRSMVWHQFGPTKDHYIDCVLWFGSTFCIYKSHQRPSDQRSPCVANLAWAPQTIMSCEMSWCHDVMGRQSVIGRCQEIGVICSTWLFRLGSQNRKQKHIDLVGPWHVRWYSKPVGSLTLPWCQWMVPSASRISPPIWLKTWIWRIQRLRCQGRWYRQQKLESLRIF